MTPVFSLEDLLDDEHLRALGFFRREEHHSEGEVRTIGIPVRFSRTPGDIRRLAPRLNEHREEILMEATNSSPR
jgi:crotonobetainyl-CoA:carnitine CoA-transferase CaiB-like acyl-CoA transferase